jgi:hypothetical protein
MRRLFALHAIAFAAFACLFAISVAQATQEGQSLEVGKPIERELTGGQQHVYQLTLAADQYLQLLAQEKGVDVAVAVFAPDGKKLADVTAPGGTQLGEAS